MTMYSILHDPVFRTLVAAIVAVLIFDLIAAQIARYFDRRRFELSHGWIYYRGFKIVRDLQNGILWAEIHGERIYFLSDIETVYEYIDRIKAVTV